MVKLLAECQVWQHMIKINAIFERKRRGLFSRNTDQVSDISIDEDYII